MASPGGVGQEAGVEGFGFGDHAVEAEVSFDSFAAGGAEAPGELGLLEELEQGRGEGSRVVRLDQQAGLAVEDDLRDWPDSAGDDWSAGRHRFQQDEAETFPEGGEDQQVPGGQEGWQVVAVAVEGDPVEQATITGVGAELVGRGQVLVADQLDS
jgi:hypothetical protein